MRSNIIGVNITLLEQDGDIPVYRVVVAFKPKYNEPGWRARQMTIHGWPPDYFFETVVKNGRQNNRPEATLYFEKTLPTEHYDSSNF